MGRMTLRLSESLHRQLEAQAKQEGVSLNQYIVYTLARYNAPSYMVRKLSEEEIAQKRSRLEELRNSLRKGTPAQVEEALNNREIVEPEPELTPEIIERLQQRIAEARKAAKKERQHA